MLTEIEKAIYNRTTRLVGESVMDKFAAARVIIIGVGGVGSWCAEGLVRSGVKNLTIVDSDRVSVTNVNRQEMATVRTIGMVKVNALKDRLLEINPHANIQTVQEIYSKETRDSFGLENYDYIIDAVDSLKDKADLILTACTMPAVFFSSMGAALKIDPTKIKVGEFWEVRGCPLAAVIRKKFKRAGTLPAKKFLCVYDDEVLPNLGPDVDCNTSDFMSHDAVEAQGKEELFNHDWSDSKAVINGTTAHITAMFGLTLSGLVVKDIYTKALRTQ